MNGLCFSCMRPTQFCICKRCTCVGEASCARCDGTLADEMDARFGDYGPVGEACAGVDWDGQPCPRRAEDSSPYCDLHSVLGADWLPTQPIPIVRIEVAA